MDNRTLGICYLIMGGIIYIAYLAMYDIDSIVIYPGALTMMILGVCKINISARDRRIGELEARVSELESKQRD